MQHRGRVAATDERRYRVGLCDGTLTVSSDRLTVEGEPHANGRERAPVVIERDGVARLHLRCGAFGASLHRELPSGYRTLLLRTKAWEPLLADLDAQAWPVSVSGLRKPRR